MCTTGGGGASGGRRLSELGLSNTSPGRVIQGWTRREISGCVKVLSEGNLSSAFAHDVGAEEGEHP